MKFAFGVQNKIEVKDIPKGTSVIAMEFTPGKPEPTPIETIQQQTVEMTQQMLEFQAGDESSGGRQARTARRSNVAVNLEVPSQEQSSEQVISAADQEQTNELVKK